MSRSIFGWAALLLLPLLAGCATTHYRPVSDTPVRIGKPYQVRGVTYVPADDTRYDMLGYASWYGEESGRMTANGERFRHGAVAGAHTTLPLPCYVEVTALDTGRTILVRINDRGPFAAGRIIDLSPAAAAQLGIQRKGIAAVRVKRVDPPERDRKRLRDGDTAPLRPTVPEGTLTSWRIRLNRVMQ
ncbi:septal ring lytic transglycosylase RlpA family protein [Sphingobium nicotianae]|uniref:septal ring lytic transglycosylase RlpA family protein n=1 Tax=Sphingobium nicotianae TaxID=2782607 RepID=UPI003D7D1D64